MSVDDPQQSVASGEPPLADTYTRLADVYDEMMLPDGGVRPHWQSLLNGLGQFSDSELQHMWDTADRLVRENGTTYNVYGDAVQSVRPWRMDPIPFLIGAKEWAQLETGLIQRARLLNAIVADIYGEQSLLKSGQLPASLIFGNPKFLRPMHGIHPANGIHLNFIAFDLARAADGRWWVMSDRTQAPSGAGYALENRVVLGRTMPEIFRNANVHRLASFFQALSDNFVALTKKDNPLAVLLTPGPMNETYFEHAYLAHYLGFPLVEGADMTVRDNKVYLKTLSGLKQVDLIFRRVDGEFCDPLELRGDSLLGVAGLTEAVRAGNVVVANSLGSGVVECEALMSFYPGLARTLLNEELLVPSLATWWCGQDLERDYVLDNFDQLIIRQTFSSNSILSPGNEVFIPGRTQETVRDDVKNRVRSRGFEFYGQEMLTLSTTPIWQDGTLQPRPMVLRVYVCADRDTFRVMPGGLTRTAYNLNAHAVSMQQGDASKDTWVVSDSLVSTFTRLTLDQPLPLRRSDSNLPSRAADNLYWLGRYAERTENWIRLIRSMILRLAGEAEAGNDPQTLTRLMKTLAALGYLQHDTALRAATGGIRAVEREVAVLLYDPQCPSGLPELLANLQRTATLVRARLSMDSWRILNSLTRRVPNYATKIRLDTDGAMAIANDILKELAAFSGMQMENMTRGLGWHLLDAGRRVERISHMARLVRDMTLDGDPEADGRLDLLLELGDSSITYRTRYLSAVQVHAVLDLLMTDDSNPRSIAFQVATLSKHLNALPRETDGATLPRENYLIAAMESELRLADILALSRRNQKNGLRDDLARFLQTLEQQVFELSEILAQKYFSHVLATRSSPNRSAV